MIQPTSFHIVTPVYNGLQWLPACIASIAAQVGDRIRVHHHIQDGGSTDGTVEWLENQCSQQPATINYHLTFMSEADEGMYDAINKGWDRADESVEWLGHLNADEQYQPEILTRIAETGWAHPVWGAVTGNCIWVDEEGGYLCSRKPSLGWPWVGRVWIPAYTCAFFVRRGFYGTGRIRFDTSWRSLGDKVFCRDLLNAGCRFGYLDEYMALFVHRGNENLGFMPVTDDEKIRYRNECLSMAERCMAPLAILVAKASRLWRNRMGRNCQNYVWIDSAGASRCVEVFRHRWHIQI